VYRADVPKRALRLLQRLLCGVIRRLLGASDKLDDLYDGHEPSSFISQRWFAASVLLHLRAAHKPASGSGRDPPAAAEPGTRADALLQGCLLPAALLRGMRRGGGLPEKALERGGDRRRLIGRRSGALDLDPGARRLPLAVPACHIGNVLAVGGRSPAIS